MLLSTSELAIRLLLPQLSDNRFATLFLHPVREEDAPGYYEIIHKLVILSIITMIITVVFKDQWTFLPSRGI